MSPLEFSAGVLATAPPILFAVLGETLTERAGVINLSLDGTLLLSAMAGFAAAVMTGSVVVGFAAGMTVGAVVAWLVAFASLSFGRSQYAVGFVLALLCRDLAYVLGYRYEHVSGPQVESLPVPGLAQLPVLGGLFFDHYPLAYLSWLAVGVTWYFVYRTHAGLRLRGLGEHPAAAYVRGIDVRRMRYVYALLGGALVGLGGASFSLLVKPGWARPYGIEGTGWIVLAIVIFGGWHPLRAAAGALLFVALQAAAGTLQSTFPSVPTQILATLPFPLMILTLLFVTIGSAEWTSRVLAGLPEGPRRLISGTLRALQASPPAALGTRFVKK
jgi:general nucleoside transport system permease protein